MSLATPQVEIRCDGPECAESLMLDLTATFDDQWTESEIEYRVMEDGWVVQGISHYCPKCWKVAAK